VIKIESAHIEELRGIKKLTIDFNRAVFAVYGPNGSGKSGVIDAIEFGLTGQISRLSGRGTKGLTVAEHGPHVDKVKFPDAAFVRLQVYLTELKKSATITRKIRSPGKVQIDPPDADIKAAIAEIEAHPEIVLSRREILRFILVEPTRRSEEIQALLKLDEIGQVRSVLNTAQNKLIALHKQATQYSSASRDALLMHLQSPDLSAKTMLDAVNSRRAVLALPAIGELTPDTRLDDGLTTAEPSKQINKQSALRDLKTFGLAMSAVPEKVSKDTPALLSHIETVEADATLLAAVHMRGFIETGLSYVDAATCPLCDTEWDTVEHLKGHLKEKLEKSKSALALQQALQTHATSIAQEVGHAVSQISVIHQLAIDHGSKDFAGLLKAWKEDLDGFRRSLGTIKGILGQKTRISADWWMPSISIATSLIAFEATVAAIPDQSTMIDAQTFLTKAQDRLTTLREARRRAEAAKSAEDRGKAAYETYCKVQETELEKLYAVVEKDFSSYYSFINDDDEADFTAKLTPTAGSLGFDVNFYGRGLYPPAAFHSEGHQDSMGVCLYLALMKRLFGSRFTFALLDDVVMSVDSGHRKQFCKLLKNVFPDTQFIITTHDRTWAEQMRFSGLVTTKTTLAFHSWSIDGGPLVESEDDIWAVIAAELAKNHVATAAGALRNHLEFATRLLADQLGAQVAFRADGGYELGDLLSGVLGRIGKLYGMAASSAHSWGNAAQKAAAGARQRELKVSKDGISVEQWAINKAVHYNEWANFSKADLEPVVETFQGLLAHFRCPNCSSFISSEPKMAPKSLRCDCSAINFNLVEKPKA
jgi:recombinational DNA repair ATPase RecF